MNERPVGVIYTGGTFGMVPSRHGYVPTTDLPERVRASMPELANTDIPAIEWIAHTGLPIDSCDTTPAFWYDLAANIARQADVCRGFVVIHGTDTLAYTGSALSFLLAGLECPVVLTGSRIPLGEPDSDAEANLLAAIRVAASGRTSEVTIAFGDRLMRANRTTKRHGSRDNPFDSPCLEKLADLGETIHWHDTQPAMVDPDLPRLEEAIRHDIRVAVLPVYPGISGDLVRAISTTGIHGLILEVYPSGVGPGSDADFVTAVSQAITNDIVVGAVSQARRGSVHMGQYASGTPLAKAGLVGGADMTREAAYTKLHTLLSCNRSPASVRTLFARDLRGELTDET